MKTKLNYRALWVQALEQGEVVLQFATEADCSVKRQGLYTSIRPFKQGKTGSPKLEKAALEVRLFRVGETTLVLQHFSRQLDGFMGNVSAAAIAVGSAATSMPAPSEPDAERLAQMAQEALRKIERTTPYYRRGGELE